VNPASQHESNSIKSGAIPGFFRRLGAQVIDNLLFWTVIGLAAAIAFVTPVEINPKSILVTMLGLREHPLYDEQQTWYSMTFLVILLLVLMRFQTTPGKKLLNMNVVDFVTGGKPTKKQFLLRGVGYTLSAIPLGAGYLWIFINKDNLGWHDLLSGTQVVFIDQ
jgi:uncharacterized RDD family membrane protein YckC